MAAGGRLDVIQRIQRLGGRHVVRLGAHAADAVGDARHFLGRPADAELLEAAQLGDDEVGVRHIPLVVQEDLDLAVAFQARDGINADLLHRAAPFCRWPHRGGRAPSSEWAMLKR